MILMYIFNIGETPAVLSKLLWKHKVGHRIVRNNDKDELWLIDSNQAQYAQSLISEYLAGITDVEVTGNSKTPSFFYQLLSVLYKTPVTFLLLFFSIGITLFSGFGSNIETASVFYFLPIEIRNGAYYAMSFDATMDQHQYWRLLTPAFLHLSIMHICFNLLWVWDIGRKVEQGVGSTLYCAGVLVVAVMANYFQYLVEHSPFFGGMSGVVYGIIAFAWLLPKLLPETYQTLISQPLMLVLMVFFALGYTDFFSMIGAGDIANTAHLTGLIIGLTFALMFAAYRRFIKQ